MIKLANRIGKLQVSGIRKMFMLAEKYDDTINLCIGEPGFSTPDHIIEACSKALKDGYTKYISNAGYLPLRKAIAEKMNTKNGFNVDYNNVIVTFGAGQSLMSAMQVILNEGDEILVPNPCFSNYMAYIALANAKAVMVPTYEEDKFHLNADVIEKYITKQTKAIIINSPSNPTGAVTSIEELQKIADLVQKHDIVVISDEPYESLVFDGHKHVSIATLDGMFERTITINSFSKTYAMTGWRLGYTVAPKEVIDAMILLQGSLTANVVAANQVAAVAALEGAQDCISEMLDSYKENRDLLVRGLNRIKGFTCINPEGAFYAMANIEETGMTSQEVAIKMLEDIQLVVTPGIAFGPDGEGYIRFSFAAKKSDIERALERMEGYFGLK